MRPDDNSPFVVLTISQVRELMGEMLKELLPASQKQVDTSGKYAYGLKGIAEVFNCSIQTAGRIKKSGIIKGAISENGRTIVVDREKAIELFGKKGGRK